MFTTGFTKTAYNMDHNNQGLEFAVSDTQELPNVGPGGMAPKGIPTYKPVEKPEPVGEKRKLTKREAARLMMYKMSAGLSDSSGSDIASGVASQLKWTASTPDGESESEASERHAKYQKAKRNRK
jgi:hypothetical protein